MVIWLENHSFNQITPSSMPYLYGLSQTYGLATDYNAITHPSLPNYLAFWSGSTQGITDDGTYNFPVSPGPAVPSLSTQMQAAGRSWRTYAEDYPAGGCNTATKYGLYVRRHDPAMSFTQKSGADCHDIRPLTAFDPGVNLAFVVPNLCNDAHDCSLGVADSFLRAFVATRVIGSRSTWAHTLLVITFDEGSGSSNRVFTVVARAGMRHIVSATPHNHYSLLRTIESLNGLAPLANARSANTLSEFLR